MTTLQTKIMGNQPQRFLGNIEQSVSFCKKHVEFTSKAVVVLGKTKIMSSCPECQREREEITRQSQDAAKTANKLRKIEKLLDSAAIPLRFKTRSFDNFKADTDGKRHALTLCKSMAVNFDHCLSHGTSLLMCGKPGTGKSHLSAAMAIEVTKQGRSAVYTSVLKAIRSIKDTYRKDSLISEQQAINAFIAPDLLIIDEVGVQFGSDTEKMYLFEILNGRYESQKPTVVITNLSPQEVTKFLGERIVDRLIEGGGGTLVFDWDSYRSKVVNDSDLPTFIPAQVNWDSPKLI